MFTVRTHRAHREDACAVDLQDAVVLAQRISERERIYMRVYEVDACGRVGRVVWCTYPRSWRRVGV